MGCHINLVVVTQVMLIRRLLPCKRHPIRLWEFNPEGPRALQHFMGTTPVEMYKLFFGAQEMCPDMTEDAGLSCNRPDTQVSNLVSRHIVHLFIMDLPFNQLSLGQEWIAQAKLIRCPGPLPETMPDPVLVKMLEVAPLDEGEGENRIITASTEEALKKGGIENPSFQGRRGLLPKIRRSRPQSGGRNLHRKVLCREEPWPHRLPRGISPPASRK